MKILIILALVLTSSLAQAKCRDIPDGRLNPDQLIVKDLLKSADIYQSEGKENQNLLEFTESLRSKFFSVSEYLSNKEIASFIIEQDLKDKICPSGTYINSETLTEVISDEIIDTYYGCGCEH